MSVTDNVGVVVSGVGDAVSRPAPGEGRLIVKGPVVDVTVEVDSSRLKEKPKLSSGHNRRINPMASTTPPKINAQRLRRRPSDGLERRLTSA